MGGGQQIAYASQQFVRIVDGVQKKLTLSFTVLPYHTEAYIFVASNFLWNWMKKLFTDQRLLMHPITGLVMLQHIPEKPTSKEVMLQIS